MPRTPRPSTSRRASVLQTPYSTASTHSSAVLQTPTSALESKIASGHPMNVKQEYLEQEVEVKPYIASEPVGDVAGTSSSSATYHPGIFVISKILARSPEIMKGPDGELEHHYLVRWAGYGPNDDTWEPRSNLLESSASLVRAFDIKPLPLRILDQSGLFFLVYFGYEGHDHPPSPLAHTQWLTGPRLKSLLGASAPRNLDQLLRAAKERRRKIREFRADKIRERKRLKREQVERRERRPPVERSKVVRDPDPKTTLLAILDKRYSKASVSCPAVVRYLCEYTIGAEEVQAWKNQRQVTRMFGSKAINDKVAVWQKKRMASETTESKTAVQSEYEKERLRRIQENQDLMKGLGL